MKSRPPGRFFVLAHEPWRVIWHHQTEDRLDLAIAYLILSCGSSGNQSTTTWGPGSINTYTGMNKMRGARLVEELGRLGLVQPLPVLAGRRGVHREPRFLLTGPDEQEEPIFLPAELVMGVGKGEEPVLRRVRRQDELCLLILVELYGLVVPDFTYAVDPSAYRSVVATATPAFKTPSATVWRLRLAASRRKDLNLGQFVEKHADRRFQLKVLSALRTAGAIHDEYWLCFNVNGYSEPLFPVTRATEAAASEAARAIWSRAPATVRGLVPLPAQLPRPHIARLMRLRVEPDTGPRRAAYLARQRVEDHWLKQFRTISETRGRFMSWPHEVRPWKD